MNRDEFTIATEILKFPRHYSLGTITTKPICPICMGPFPAEYRVAPLFDSEGRIVSFGIVEK